MQIHSRQAIIQIPPLAPGRRLGDLLAHLVGGGQGGDGAVEVGGGPEGLALGGSEGVGDVDVAEEDDGGVRGGGDAVVEPVRGVQGGFGVVGWGGGEAGEVVEDSLVGFLFELGVAGVVGGGFVDGVGEAEVCGLGGREEGGGVGGPAGAAEEHVGGDFGAVF